MPISGVGMDMPVSGFDMKKSVSGIEVLGAPITRQRTCPFVSFMDDTYIVDPIERRNEVLNDLIRDYTDQMLQLHNLRKSSLTLTSQSMNRVRFQKGKISNQRIEDLGSHVRLVSELRRTGYKIRLLSAKTQSRPRLTRRRFNLVLPRHTRRFIEGASEDNLCQAVQGLQLNSENSVRKSGVSGLMLSGDISLAKVDSPSKVAEDLSKLCMN